MKTILEDGTIEYRNDLGQRHREDGPAVTFPNGTKCWYLHGKRHREDGPAATFPTGVENWLHLGVFHREDGPAVINEDGSKEWWLNGKQIPYEFTSLKDLYEKHPEYMI